MKYARQLHDHAIEGASRRSLTRIGRAPSMRLQLHTASTGTSTSSHGHRSEPGWWKPAWHGTGEWTREPRSERCSGQGGYRDIRPASKHQLGGDGRPPLPRADASALHAGAARASQVRTVGPKQGGTAEEA